MSKKKALIISSSLRPESNSHALCEEVARGVEAAGGVARLVRCEETREREFGAHEAVRTTGRKLMLTMDRLDMSDGDIRHRFIPDFLCEADGQRP